MLDRSNKDFLWHCLHRQSQRRRFCCPHVYEVLSSHRSVIRRGCWQQKISPSAKRKQPRRSHADSKSKHQPKIIKSKT
ncbi:hypothetical protein C0J52_24842 [Blattella germanica]|nr:hypothetical protein C0J52_24842 [Blattella germanica]